MRLRISPVEFVIQKSSTNSTNEKHTSQVTCDMTNDSVFSLILLGKILQSNSGTEFVRKVGCLESFMSSSHGWYVNHRGSGSLAIKHNKELGGIVDELYLTEEGYGDLLAVNPDKAAIADRSSLGLLIQDALKTFRHYKFKNKRSSLFPTGHNALLLVDFSELDTPVEFWKSPASNHSRIDAFKLTCLASGLRQPIACSGSDSTVVSESIEDIGFSPISGTQLLSAFYQAQLAGLLQPKERYFFWLCPHALSFPLTRLISSLLINWERYLVARFVLAKESYLGDCLEAELPTTTPLWVWNMALLCDHVGLSLMNVLGCCVENSIDAGEREDASKVADSLSAVKNLIRFLVNEPTIVKQYGFDALPASILSLIADNSASMN